MDVGSSSSFGLALGPIPSFHSTTVQYYYPSLFSFFSSSNYLLESIVVVPEPLGGDLVLFADLYSGLLEDLQPWMGQSLPHAHTLLGLVDQKVGHEVLGLAGNVLPQLEVEINVAHLDTLEGFPVILE